MNRIKISSLANYPIEESPVQTTFKLPSGLAAQPEAKFDPPVSLPTSRTGFDPSECCLFVPLHYEKNYEYPLVVWLHNNGDDASQLNRVMPSISLQNFVAVAPQSTAGDSHRGYYWDQNSASIEDAADNVLASIELARYRTNISSRKVFIAGYGAAGTMAFRVALTHPDLFAGVASLNGPLPEGSAPLGRWSCSRNLEVFWSHSRQSEDFQQKTLCRQLKLLHVAGFSVTLRQYPGNDEMSVPSLSDLNRWIMQLFDSTIA